MDIDTILQTLAEKYGFIQNSDIEMVETSELFDRTKYLALYNKKFISIDKNEISVGKILIEIDSYDEQEWYTIDKHTFFRINIDDYLTEDSLTEDIIKKYHHYSCTTEDDSDHLDDDTWVEKKKAFWEKHNITPLQIKGGSMRPAELAKRIEDTFHR